MTVRNITKQPAAVEDLLLGTGTEQQLRNGSLLTVNKIALMQPVADLAALKALDVAKYAYATIQGGLSYYFDSTSTATADSYSVIAPTTGTGRWLLAGSGLEFPTVAALKAASLPAGVSVSVQANKSRYFVEAGDSSDGYTNVLLFNGNTAVLQYSKTLISSKAGIVADRVTDDTLAIQAAINRIYADGGGELFLTGNALVSDEIDWPETVDIVGPYWRLSGADFTTTYGGGLFLKDSSALGGSKGVIRAKMRAADAFKFHSGKLRNLTIHGNGDTNGGTAGGGTQGVIIDSCKTVGLDRVFVTRCSGAGIGVTAPTGTPNGLTVSKCVVSFNYDNGLFIIGGEHAITDSYIGNNSGNGISNTSGGVRINSCGIADNGKDGISLIDTKGGAIAGNVIQDNARNGIQLSSTGGPCDFLSITGNDIFDNGINEDSLSGPYTTDNRCGIRFSTGNTLNTAVYGNTITNRRLVADSEHPIVSPSQQYGIYFSSTATRVKGSNNVSLNVVDQVRTASVLNYGLPFGDGTDAETINEYSTGTWTPSLFFGGADTGNVYSAQDGTYQRIGNTITATAQINLSTKGSATGSATINLPTGFTPTIPGAAFMRANGLAAGVGSAHLQALIFTGGGTLNLSRLSSGASVNLADTDFGNTSSLTITAVYFV